MPEDLPPQAQRDLAALNDDPQVQADRARRREAAAARAARRATGATKDTRGEEHQWP